MKRLAVIILIFSLSTLFAQNINLKPRFTKSSLNSERFISNLNRTFNSEPDTFRILAIRVEFVEDDDETTTGNGKFDLSEDTDIQFDPPPHNKFYFEDHLESLKRYYENASKGKVYIEYTVFPAGTNEAYQLPENMLYYNPVNEDEEMNQKLAELFKDAILTTDNDSQINFSLYNSFIVLHAGAGSDFSIEDIEEFNPTPNDLPSAYLYLNDLRDTIGNENPDYAGIPVDNGTFFVQNGLIIPETESKYDSYETFFNIGLNGIIAHHFGHHLGLPSLFNTSTGQTAIGKFGLMDVGFANVDGLVPALPSAWCRYFLGWEEPVNITQGINHKVAEFYTETVPHLYKIDINANEYFLIENRQQDPDNDSLKITISPRGVVIEADDQDFDILASGILIWHIDENIIYNNFLTNTINADQNKKGIALEEADGAIDIGLVHEDILPGFFSPINGQLFDAFFADTIYADDTTYIGNSYFTPFTNPNTNSNSGAKSHIYITDISHSGNIMTFDLNIRHMVEGFPYYIKNADNICLTATDKGEIIAVDTSSNYLYVWDNIGQPVYTYSYNEDIQKFNTVKTYPLYVFYETENRIATMPAASDFDNDGYTEFIIGDETGKFYLFRISGTQPQLVDKFDLDPPGKSKLIAYNSHTGINFIYTTMNKRIAAFDMNGIIKWEFTNWEYPNQDNVIENAIHVINNNPAVVYTRSDGPVYRLSEGLILSTYNMGEETANKIISADINKDGKDELVILTNMTLHMINSDFEKDQSFNLMIDENFEDLAMGDINNDGAPEIIAYRENFLYVFNRNGTLSDNFPFDLKKYKGSGNFSSTPLIADINEDGTQEIIIGTDSGEILCISGNGEPVSDFSFSTSNTIKNVFIHSNNNGEIIVSALSGDNFIYSWDTESEFNVSNISWRSKYNDALNSSRYLLTKDFTPKTYSVLMPKERVYNYPNPNEDNFTIIRYYLTESADVNIKIFDLTGDLIKSMAGPGSADIDNEVKWDLTNISSGVYLARVESASATKKEHKIIKIAVIK